MIEIWKDIPNFEGYYQVSNFGNVKSFGKNANNQYANIERVLKPNIDNNGYYALNLYKNSFFKRVLVHRLIANVFLPNPQHLPCINHIDGNKLNNSIDNLEWCSYGHNEKEAYKIGLKKPAFKKVNQYDLKGNFIKQWNSIKDAQNFYKTSHISQCCCGKRTQTKGFAWEYANE